MEIREKGLKGYSSVNLIHGLTHRETVLDSLSRDQGSTLLIYRVLSTSEKDCTITIYCSTGLQQETAIKKPAEVRCPGLCAETLFVQLLKFGVVLSIICGFLVAVYSWIHLLRCIVVVRLFLRMLNLRELALCKLLGLWWSRDRLATNV